MNPPTGASHIARFTRRGTFPGQQKALPALYDMLEGQCYYRVTIRDDSAETQTNFAVHQAQENAVLCGGTMLNKIIYQ